MAFATFALTAAGFATSSVLAMISGFDLLPTASAVVFLAGNMVVIRFAA